MLVACRLASLCALEAQYECVIAHAQSADDRDDACPLPARLVGAVRSSLV